MVENSSLKSLCWKRRIARLCFFSKKNNRKIVLIYHAVGSGPWSIPTELFKQQIRWLKENVDIVPITELLNCHKRKNKTQVAITFDDGYSCLYSVVLPILKAEQIVATVYINTQWIADSEYTHKNSRADLGHYPNEKFLTWNEVNILSTQGWEIGSHGVDHIDLTKQSENIIQQELINSKITIEDKLQKKCTHFAYTWGRHNMLVESEVKNAGYQYAAAAHHGVITCTDNLLALPRMNVALEYTITDFKNMITGKFDFLSYIHRIKKYKASIFA